MSYDGMTKENKIFNAACNIFFLFGYHGTTMYKIAEEAGVMKAAIHYYFRSKENIYTKVVFSVIDNLLKQDISLDQNQKIPEKQKWFLYTELHNNYDLFEKAVKFSFPDNCDKIINKIKDMLKQPFSDAS